MTLASDHPGEADGCFRVKSTTAARIKRYFIKFTTIHHRIRTCIHRPSHAHDSDGSTASQPGNTAYRTQHLIKSIWCMKWQVLSKPQVLQASLPCSDASPSKFRPARSSSTPISSLLTDKREVISNAAPSSAQSRTTSLSRNLKRIPELARIPYHSVRVGMIRSSSARAPAVVVNHKPRSHASNSSLKTPCSQLTSTHVILPWCQRPLSVH